MSWDERFDRWGQAIGARYWLWMLGVLLLAGGLMSISLAIAPFVMLLPEFSPTGSVLAAREMGRMQAQQGVATQSNEVQTQQQYVVETFVVIFRHRAGGNLLSAPVLQRIKGMEDAILNYPGYEELCMRTAGVDPPVCQPPASIVNEAYASKRSLGGDAEITVLDRLGNLTDDPAGAIFGAVDDGTEWLLQLLAKDDACRHPPHHCTYARTLFLLAGPLAGYSNLQERKQEQAARVLAFLEKITRDVLRPLAHNSSEPVQIVFTVTEAAAVAVVYALFVELVINRELKVTEVPRILADSAVMMGSLFLVLVIAISLNRFFAFQQIPEAATAWMVEHVSTPFMFLIMVNLFLLALGCVMDILSAILIVAPLLAPIAASYGIHPIHFGIMFIVNLELGYLTPPMGINLFVATTVFDRPVLDVIRAVLPFLLLMLICLAIIVFFPSLSLALIDATATASPMPTP